MLDSENSFVEIFRRLTTDEFMEDPTRILSLMMDFGFDARQVKILKMVMSEDMKEMKEFLECPMGSGYDIVEKIAEYCLVSENALREILDGIRASLKKNTDAVKKQPDLEVGPTIDTSKQIDVETEITDDGPYGECRISLDGIARYSLDMMELLRVEDTVSFEIPHSVVKIRSWAFKDCISLTEVYMSDSVKEIGKEVFLGCKSLIHVIIPESMKMIREKAFCGCESLEEVYVPDSVTEIGKEAFRNCTSLRKMRIPDSVIEISPGTFQNCESLDEVHFSNSVTTIGEYAFSGCGSLEDLHISDSVMTIDDYAFDCCQSLKTVYIPRSVVYIGEDAFRGCFHASFAVDPENKNYYSKSGKLINRNA